jgi:hypothetical protein
MHVLHRIYFSFIIILLMIAACQPANTNGKQESSKQLNDTLKNTQNNIPGLNYQEVLGRQLVFDFGNAFYNIIISSDSTLYWKDQKTGQDEHEKTQIIPVNKHANMVSWLEADGTFVCMYADFETGKALVFLYTKTGEIVPLTGKIKLNR